MNMQNVLYRCNDCKSTIDLSIVEIKKQIFKFEGRQSMWLTHFDCPNCKKTIFCQIDNAETNAILQELTTLIARIARYRKRGQTIPQKLQSKYNRNSKKLNSLRSELLRTYNNQWFEDENKHSIKVRFVKNFGNG